MQSFTRWCSVGNENEPGGPLKETTRDGLYWVIPSFPAEHQQVYGKQDGFALEPLCFLDNFGRWTRVLERNASPLGGAGLCGLRTLQIMWEMCLGCVFWVAVNANSRTGPIWGSHFEETLAAYSSAFSELRQNDLLQPPPEELQDSDLQRLHGTDSIVFFVPLLATGVA